MITILDGGMGGELLRREVTPRGELWSAQALLDAPEKVLEVHRDYIAAGARIIITNSYSTIPSYLGKLGLEDRFEELAALAGKLARRAADESDEQVLVAGSLPPLDESYRPDLVPADELAGPVYERLARALEPQVDAFLCETMSSIRESVNAARAARSVGGADKPLYVSWTLAEEAGKGLRSGESIEAAVAAVEGFDIAAYLFNCTSLQAITAGLETLKGLTDRPIGAYPNRFNVPDGWTLDNNVQTEYVEMPVSAFVEQAGRWAEQGVSIIGGCCGIGPDYIEALAGSIAER
ncbi:MAG: homocysteine S-methyltransferase family protein [Pseudomonadota bacterium]